VRAHAKALGYRLKVFVFFVNAVSGTPPPSLMNKWTMRGIHKPDDAVIDADRHFRLQIGEFVA
jgi:hypothetical protein